MNKQRFEEMVRFMQGMKKEDVYGSSAIKRDITSVSNDIIVNNVNDNKEDDIILPFNCIPMHKVYGNR